MYLLNHEWCLLAKLWARSAIISGIFFLVPWSISFKLRSVIHCFRTHGSKIFLKDTFQRRKIVRSDLTIQALGRSKPRKRSRLPDICNDNLNDVRATSECQSQKAAQYLSFRQIEMTKYMPYLLLPPEQMKNDNCSSTSVNYTNVF